MRLYQLGALMHVKRSDFVVEFKEACEIATKFFLENDYASIDEAKDASDKWLFSPKCKKTCYGVSYICVPKNGDEPYLFNPTGMDNILMWKNAKIVSV
mgnify:CR=1 FL=1